MLMRSLAWMGLAQGISVILQFTASIVLARYLTPYEMGIYAVALATTASLSIIQAMGLQSLIVREETLTPSLSSSAFSINALIAVTLAGTIFASGFLGGAAFHDDGVRRVLVVLAINPLLGALEFLPSANLERAGQFKIMSMVATAASLTGTIFTISLAVLGFRYMSIAYAQVAALIVSAILYNIVGWRHVRFAVGFKDWRRIGNFGLQMLMTTGVNSITRRLSDIILGRFLGLTALGVFNRAGNLQGLLWTNIYLVLSRVLLVDFSQHHRRGESLRERYIMMMECFTAILWPAFCGFALLAGPFLHAVYGDRWLAATRPLVLLCAASVLQVSLAMTFEVFVAKGELGKQTRIEIIKSVIFLPIFIIGCQISVEAAAAARVFDAMISILLYRRALDRATDTRLRDLIPGYLKSGFVTFVAVAPALLVMVSHRMNAATPIISLVLAISSGLALWATASFCCNIHWWLRGGVSFAAFNRQGARVWAQLRPDPSDVCAIQPSARGATKRKIRSTWSL